MRAVLLSVVTAFVLVQPVMADPSDLGGGVFIAHHPAALQFSSSPPPEGWCRRYLDSHAITSCEAQVNRIDTEDAVLWFVIAAWEEDKQWRGVEFGLGEYNAASFAIVEHGPCFPMNGLEIPSGPWPGPNAGVSLAVTDSVWHGNFQPVYFFAGYSYAATQIPLGPNPGTAFGGTANCLSPPQQWAADAFGAMGLFQEGEPACPGDSIGPLGGLPLEDGVCCLDQVCYIAPAELCTAQGGVPFPEYTLCQPNPCLTCPSGQQVPLAQELRGEVSCTVRIEAGGRYSLSGSPEQLRSLQAMLPNRPTYLALPTIKEVSLIGASGLPTGFVPSSLPEYRIFRPQVWPTATDPPLYLMCEDGPSPGKMVVASDGSVVSLASDRIYTPRRGVATNGSGFALFLEDYEKALGRGVPQSYIARLTALDDRTSIPWIGGVAVGDQDIFWVLSHRAQDAEHLKVLEYGYLTLAQLDSRGEPVASTFVHEQGKAHAIACAAHAPFFIYSTTEGEDLIPAGDPRLHHPSYHYEPELRYGAPPAYRLGHYAQGELRSWPLPPGELRFASFLEAVNGNLLLHAGHTLLPVGPNGPDVGGTIRLTSLPGGPSELPDGPGEGDCDFCMLTRANGWLACNPALFTRESYPNYVFSLRLWFIRNGRAVPVNLSEPLSLVLPTAARTSWQIRILAASLDTVVLAIVDYGIVKIDIDQ